VKNRNEPNIQIRSIIDRVVHPAYQPISINEVYFCDAAILKVDRPFILNAFVRKVNLPPYDFDPPGKSNTLQF
jgi:hypothetical protein